MRQIIVIIIIFSVTFSIGSQEIQNSKEAQNNNDILTMAENAFHSGNDLLDSSPLQAKENYILAAFYYNSLLDRGIQNAELFYNTGNAFYRAGQIGNAVLMYRRALLFSPSDPQIKFNLNQARLVQKNQLDYDSGSELVRILLFSHSKIPFSWKLWSLLFTNLLFWSTLILFRFRKGPYTFSVVIGIFGILLMTSLVFDLQNISTDHGVVIAESTTGRMGDSINFEASFDTALFQGLEFTVMERRVGWVLAKLNNGDITWIEEKDCRIIEELSS